MNSKELARKFQQKLQMSKYQWMDFTWVKKTMNGLNFLALQKSKGSLPKVQVKSKSFVANNQIWLFDYKYLYMDSYDFTTHLVSTSKDGKEAWTSRMQINLQID